MTAAAVNIPWILLAVTVQ